MVCDKVVDKNIDSTNVNYIECDVSDRESFKNAFLATEQKLGKVNVLVNNAGILREHNYEGLSKDPPTKVFDCDFAHFLY